MSFNAGNSAGERQARKQFGQAGYSVIKRRAAAKKMRWMSPEDERRAIEEFIAKNGVKKIVLKPPPPPPPPPTPAPANRYAHWSEAETAMLRTLKAKGFGNYKCAALMGRAYETIRRRAQSLTSEKKPPGPANDGSTLRWTYEMEQELRRKVDEGKSITAAAREMGISKGAALRRAKTLRIKSTAPQTRASLLGLR